MQPKSISTPPKSGEAKGEYHIEALSRGLAVLSAVTHSPTDLNLTEIARAVGLSPSTTLGFLRALEQAGYLNRDPDTRRYRVGVRLLGLSLSVLGQDRLADTARHYAEDLARRTGESVCLAILDGDEVMLVAIAESDRAQRVLGLNFTPGTRLPAYCTCAGRALLMDAGREELGAILGEGPYPSRTPRTLTTLDELWMDLERSRARGYAVQDGEVEAGFRSVSVPVRDASRRIVASLAVAGPSARVSLRSLEALIPDVMRTAQELSSALGVKVAYGPRAPADDNVAP